MGSHLAGGGDKGGLAINGRGAALLGAAAVGQDSIDNTLMHFQVHVAATARR
eukprot:GDKH01016406.1.p2 GENE.GDKH01016406.1~~GDKH01016406.1.p2  ORF type:complete len:52 (-),score=17.79 GDKH01016406.1:119-274(-)